MKRIIFTVLAFSVLGLQQTQAGLFDYYLGNGATSNASQEEMVDAVESLEYSHPRSVDTSTYTTNTYSQYNASYNSSYRYYNSCTNWSYGQVRDCSTRIGVSNGSANFFERDDLLDMLEDELDEVQGDIDRVEDVIRDIKSDIKQASRYITPYYRNLRAQLEDDLEYFEEEKERLEDREDELQDEITRVKRSVTNSRVYYYDRVGSYNASYNSYRYSRYDYYPYYYRNTLPVNTDLEEVKDGRVYIR